MIFPTFFLKIVIKISETFNALHYQLIHYTGLCTVYAIYFVGIKFCNLTAFLYSQIKILDFNLITTPTMQSACYFADFVSQIFPKHKNLEFNPHDIYMVCTIFCFLFHCLYSNSFHSCTFTDFGKSQKLFHWSVNIENRNCQTVY